LLLLEQIYELLPCHEFDPSDFIERGSVGQIEIAHVVVGIEYIPVEHLGEECLL